MKNEAPHRSSASPAEKGVGKQRRNEACHAKWESPGAGGQRSVACHRPIPSYTGDAVRRGRDWIVKRHTKLEVPQEKQEVCMSETGAGGGQGLRLWKVGLARELTVFIIACRATPSKGKHSSLKSMLGHDELKQFHDNDAVRGFSHRQIFLTRATKILTRRYQI